MVVGPTAGFLRAQRRLSVDSSLLRSERISSAPGRSDRAGYSVAGVAPEQRDAAVGNYIDREEAGLTAADVRRFEKSLEDLAARRDKLARKREMLMMRLPD